MPSRQQKRSRSKAALPKRPSRSVSVCSFLLAILFAYSSAVQLDDVEWYFWLPLYSLAFFVCLAHMIRFSAVSRLAARVDLVCGALLFVKVVSAACWRDGVFSWAEFASLDLEQSLVREKFGSLIVCLSMWLELEVSGGAVRKSGYSPASLHAGMFALVSASAGLCAAFFSGTSLAMGRTVTA